MDPKKDFKKFFQKMFDTPVEIQGEILTPEETTKKNFITFVDNYKTAVTRSQEITDKFGLDLWSWEDMFAKSLEGLINYSFTPELVEVILWYVYEHSLAEDDSDRTVTDEEGNEYLITNSIELYELILKMDIEE